ncbi:23215_t:CDS:1, partial [Gigaspora margarita]
NSDKLMTSETKLNTEVIINHTLSLLTDSLKKLNRKLIRRQSKVVEEVLGIEDNNN